MAATQRAAAKLKKYQPAFASHKEGVSVIPFALETYGASDAGVARLISALTKHAEQLSNEDPLQFGVWAWHTVSVALQVGNALAIQSAASKCSTRSFQRIVAAAA